MCFRSEGIPRYPAVPPMTGPEIPASRWRTVYWITVVYGILTIVVLWWFTDRFHWPGV